jgi:hypothetical protein
LHRSRRGTAAVVYPAFVVEHARCPGQEGSFAHREPIAASVLSRNGIVTGFAPAADRPLAPSSALLSLPALVWVSDLLVFCFVVLRYVIGFVALFSAGVFHARRGEPRCAAPRSRVWETPLAHRLRPLRCDPHAAGAWERKLPSKRRSCFHTAHAIRASLLASATAA